MEPRSAALVVNPRSRRGAGLLDDAPARFAAAGLRLVAVHRAGDDPVAAVDAAIAEASDVVVVAGGDGTVSTAVGRFAHSAAVLGIVPTGTTNNFARSLGLPMDPDAALEVVARGVVTDVDLGLAGDQHFANVATVGISVDVAHHVPAGLKRVLGRGAYALTGLAALLRHRSIVAHLETEHGVLAYRTHQLVVANGRFHAGMLLGEGIDPDDDRLIVFHLGDRRRIELLRSLLLMALGRPRTLTRDTAADVRRARLITVPPQDVELDGEIRARTPLELRIDLEALRVVVPRALPSETTG